MRKVPEVSEYTISAAGACVGVLKHAWRRRNGSTENLQDSTSQKIFDLEKLVFLLVLASVPCW